MSTLCTCFAILHQGKVKAFYVDMIQIRRFKAMRMVPWVNIIVWNHMYYRALDGSRYCFNWVEINTIITQVICEWK